VALSDIMLIALIRVHTHKMGARLMQGA